MLKKVSSSDNLFRMYSLIDNNELHFLICNKQWRIIFKQMSFHLTSTIYALIIFSTYTVTKRQNTPLSHQIS